MSPFPASGLPWLTGRVRRRRMLRPQAASHRGRAVPSSGPVRPPTCRATRRSRPCGRSPSPSTPAMLAMRSMVRPRVCRRGRFPLRLPVLLAASRPCRADGKPARNGKRKGQSSLRRWRRGARRWPRDPTADSRRRSPRVASLGRAARRAEDFAGRSGSGAKPNFRFHGRFRFAV